MKQKEVNNNIKEDYCSFEVSGLLKEKGFNCNITSRWIETFAHTIWDYRNNEEITVDTIPPRILKGYIPENSEVKCLAPTQALAIKWIRENFNIHIYTKVIFNLNKSFIVNCDTNKELLFEYWGLYESIEEAINVALLYTLRNLTMT